MISAVLCKILNDYQSLFGINENRHLAIKAQINLLSEANNLKNFNF